MKFVGGLPETRCGAGSTISNTETIRAWLPKLFKEFGIKTLLDAPCGDFNWMNAVDISGISYIGLDYDVDNIETARSKNGLLDFRATDIVSGRIPKADLLLCRDFLQHLPNRLVFKFLENVKSSGTKMILVTSHNNAANEDISTTGDFRRLNLECSPFSFPAPVKSIDDGEGRILGLWPWV